MDNVIHCYTRADAIEDGVLIDVTKTAQEAGFRIPVALTAAVWGKFVAVPKGIAHQDESGQLWDVLWMLRFRISQVADQNVVTFVVHVQNDDGPARPKLLKAICGPGDEGEPVITVMGPDED